MRDQDAKFFTKPKIVEDYYYGESQHPKPFIRPGRLSERCPTIEILLPKYDFLNKEELEVIESLKSKNSKSKSSHSIHSLISPNPLFNDREKELTMFQQGTTISVLNIQNEHEKDVLLHFLEKKGIIPSRTIFLNEASELIITMDEFSKTERLKEALRLSGVMDQINDNKSSFAQ